MIGNEVMGRGPYRRKRMVDLNDAELQCVEVWAQAELDGVESGDGRCEYARYRDELWCAIAETDKRYYRWAEKDYTETVREARILLECRAEQRAREREQREHAERLAAAAAGGDPIFTPVEEREIATGDLLGVIEACFVAGYKQHIKNHHPDKGGDSEFVVRLNQGDQVFRKILAALRQEMKGES